MRDSGGDFGFIRPLSSGEVPNEICAWIAQATDVSRDTPTIEHWQLLGLSDTLFSINRIVSTGSGTRGERHAAIGVVLRYSELYDIGSKSTAILSALASVVITFANQRSVDLSPIAFPLTDARKLTDGRLRNAQGLVLAILNHTHDGACDWCTAAHNPIHQVLALLDALYITKCSLRAQTVLRTTPALHERARGQSIQVSSLASLDSAAKTQNEVAAKLLTSAAIAEAAIEEWPKVRDAQLLITWSGKKLVEMALHPEDEKADALTSLLRIAADVPGVPNGRELFCAGLERAEVHPDKVNLDGLLLQLDGLVRKEIIPQFFVWRIAVQKRFLNFASAANQRALAEKIWPEFSDLMRKSGCLDRLGVRRGVMSYAAKQCPVSPQASLVKFVDGKSRVTTFAWLHVARSIVEAGSAEGHLQADYQAAGNWLVAACHSEGDRLQLVELFHSLDDGELNRFIRALYVQYIGRADSEEIQKSNAVNVQRLICVAFGCSKSERVRGSARHSQLERLWRNCGDDVKRIWSIGRISSAVDLARAKLMEY